MMFLMYPFSLTLSALKQKGPLMISLMPEEQEMFLFVASDVFSFLCESLVSEQLDSTSQRSEVLFLMS